MIKRMSHAGVYVLDQERAKAFYTEKLGLEVRQDVTMEGFRWLTVGPKEQPDFEIVLSEPKPPMVDEETAKTMHEFIARGAFGAGVLEVDDCYATFNELTRKGVTFVQEPAERPYGIEAVLRDDSGNWFSVTERRTIPGATYGKPTEAAATKAGSR